MKRNIFLLFLIFFFFLFLNAEEDLLKIEASISPQRLSKGQEGKVVLKLTLEKGIAINALPSFIIELNPSNELVFPKNFFNASDLDIEIIDKNGDEHLDLEEPLEIPFTVSLEAKSGRHNLEGKIKYFASSKGEGWCLKSTSKFSASFYTRNRVVKKK